MFSSYIPLSINNKPVRGRPVIDLTGKKFGRLTVVERFGTEFSHNGSVFPIWTCQCDCGNIVVVRGASLRKGLTRSCGCYHAEITSLKRKGQRIERQDL